MLLALCRARHLAQARADFMRYYGLRFDAEARERPREAADLLAMLPPSSRTFAALRPGEAPADPAVVLAAAELDLRAALWALGGGRGPRPSALTAASSAPPAGYDAATVGFVRAALGMDGGEG